jgi:hypothetical protein
LVKENDGRSGGREENIVAKEHCGTEDVVAAKGIDAKEEDESARKRTRLAERKTHDSFVSVERRQWTFWHL